MVGDMTLHGNALTSKEWKMSENYDVRLPSGQLIGRTRHDPCNEQRGRVEVARRTYFHVTSRGDYWETDEHTVPALLAVGWIDSVED